MNTAPIDELDARIIRLAEIIGEDPHRTLIQILKAQLDRLERAGGLRAYMAKLTWAEPVARDAAFERLAAFERAQYAETGTQRQIRLLERSCVYLAGIKQDFETSGLEAGDVGELFRDLHAEVSRLREIAA